MQGNYSILPSVCWEDRCSEWYVNVELRESKQQFSCGFPVSTFTFGKTSSWPRVFLAV